MKNSKANASSSSSAVGADFVDSNASEAHKELDFDESDDYKLFLSQSNAEQKSHNWIFTWKEEYLI